jgi:hypothetical protein
MQLIQRYTQSLDTLKSTVEDHVKQRPRQCADACLQGQIYQEKLNIPQIQQRLQQLEEISPFLARLEEMFNQPNLRRLHLPLEKQWQRALDRLADSDAEPYTAQFIARLTILSQFYDVLWQSYHNIEKQDVSYPEGFQQFKYFLSCWRALWLHFFDFQNPTADQSVRIILSRFPPG